MMARQAMATGNEVGDAEFSLFAPLSSGFLENLIHHPKVAGKTSE